MKEDAMKHISIFLLLLCINIHMQSMEEEMKPLLNQKNNGLSAETLGSIHDQLPSTGSIESTQSEQSLMNQIIKENNQTFCSPTCDDLYHPKKLIVKTALTLCLAGLFDGGISGAVASILACCDGASAASFVCSPLYQSIFAPISCCLCWSRRCVVLTLAIDHAEDIHSSHNEHIKHLHII